MSPTDKQSFGMNGCELIPAGDSSSAGAFCAIQFITEGTLTDITSGSVEFITGGIEDFTFPAGFVLYVPFTGVTTGSATVVAYKASL